MQAKKTKEDIKDTISYIYYKNKDGNGGIAVNKVTGDKVYIATNHDKFAQDNDEVTVEIMKKPRFNPPANLPILEGKICKILSRNTLVLVGFIIKAKGRNKQAYLDVLDNKFGEYVVELDNVPDDFSQDELFRATITKYPSQAKPFFKALVVESLGLISEDETYINKLIIESGIATSWSFNTLEELKDIPNEVLKSDLKGREDLRHLTFVTIDGVDAKDFDDAVYCELNKDGYELYVAIADVAHYVKSGTALDQDAYLRGNSVYLPKQVIPMLPEELSNEMCSLKPLKDRLTMCVKMHIDKNGTILKYEVMEAIINSKARLIYEEVQSWLDDLSLIKDSNLMDNISNLYKVYQALIKARNLRGAIELDSNEPRFVFDENGLVSKIIVRTRLEAHKLIEECMLAANVSIANFLVDKEEECLFRIHEKPSEEKFQALRTYLNSLGINFNVDYGILKPGHYGELVEELQDNPHLSSIQLAILRSMQLAIYSPTNIGHFGLNYDKYLHFTSPIRRYPDLLVHRILKKVIKKKGASKTLTLPPVTLEASGIHLSDTERKSAELERKVHAFYKCSYAKGHIGSTFRGVISTVVNFGIFVYLPDLMIEGLVHVSRLGADYFIFNEANQTLNGKKSGLSFKAGDEYEVVIVSVDMARLFIDLEISI